MLKMLQTNCNNNNNTLESQVDIVKRLEKLNKWQEEQKRLLDERQNMQRKMLGLEQQNMYEILGLFHSNQVIESDMNGAGDMLEGVNDMNRNAKGILQRNIEIDNDITAMENRLFKGMENQQVTTAKQQNFDDIVSKHEAEDATKVPKPKRPFLRRGEGIKQRFRISPDALRLNNLPRYKYVTTHPKIKHFNRRRTALKTHPTMENIRATGNVVAETKSQTQLDVKEKQFQQVLLQSKVACNSTPDAKLSNTTMSSISIMLPKVRFEGNASNNEDSGEDNNVEKNTQPSHCTALTWAKVLDPQHIKPIRLDRTERIEGIKDNNARDDDDDNMSIFELLERQAADGTLDMNSSCIKKFMQRKALKNDENMDDDVSIVKRFTEAGLRPAVEDVLRDDSSDDDENPEEIKENNTLCDTSTYLSEATRVDSTANSDKEKIDTRVRFSDDNTTCEYDNHDDAISEGSTLPDEETASNKSSDLFHQFKDALFAALLGRNDCDGINTDSKSVLQPPPSALTQELQEKSNLIKFRLEELEKEICAFKNNNMELMRAKQEYELERAHFNQERSEALDRLKDDKIQMEMYLHDERMKIEEDKRKFEHRMRVEKTALANKEKKEIARLKEETEILQIQLKQKEQAHASAQARLRVQIRNLERDQKHLYEDIERLTKENKRLQSEKQKLEREGSNKMLLEINRNIAKLAPKLTSINTTNTEPLDSSGRPIGNRSQKLNHLAPGSKSLGRANHKPPKSLKVPPNSRSSSKTDVSIGVLEIEMENNNNEQETKKTFGTYEFDADLEDEDGDDELLDDVYTVQKVATKSEKTLQNLSSSNNLKLTSGQKLVTVREANESDLTKCNPASATAKNTPNEKTEKDANESFRREIINSDGSRDIWYPNGNLKKISADGMNIRMLYFNKDIKETNVNEGTVKYYYAETNTWHTTYLDGLEIFEFPNGQTEHRHKSGMVEIHFPDNSVKIINPADDQKLEEWRFADGTNLMQMRNGDKILIMPNGQKEIHTKLNKRREYPDGTVKLVYPDGSQETRYSNGRVRLKDKDGNLVMDTENI